MYAEIEQGVCVSIVSGVGQLPYIRITFKSATRVLGWLDWHKVGLEPGGSLAARRI